MAGNLDKVTVHADMLDKVANDMSENGIGLHPTRGHVAQLRAMSAAMRVDAANGKVPHAFTDNNYYASADLPPPVVRTLQAAGLPPDGRVTIENFDAAMAKASDVEIGDRLAAKQMLGRLGRLL